ncbi:MAG TPA: ABC transporter permease [Jatrophihabitans sp.]|nr:ABC transporter permease [Jatrophihabitans sp.]
MNSLTGTRDLLRLYVRRDRVKLPAGILLMALVMASNVSGFKRLYSTAQERADFARGIDSNNAQLFLYGAVHRGDTLGGLVAWRSAAIGGVVMGLISLFLVIRHTRGEEESGRAELVLSGRVGQRAQLTAALVLALVSNLGAAAYILALLLFYRLPAGGSVALSLGLAAVGMVFAGVGAVAAQLTESARTARGIAATVLGAAFLLRALGDTSASTPWLSWLSPVGWVERLLAFAGDRWWVFAAFLAATAVLAGAGYLLSARRDFGAGIWPARLGPAAAPPSLRSPFGLAWRLQRPALLGWSVGFAVVGATVGGAGKGISAELNGSDSLKKLFRNLGGHGDLTDAYLATAMSILGLLAAAYAVQAALRPSAEEAAGRVEPLLATQATRLGWLGGHLAFAVLGPAVVLAVGGLATGVVYGAATHSLGHQVPRLLAGALVQLPAVWILAAIAVALFGLAPRAVQAGWGALVVFVLLGQIGSAFGWDQALLDVSPFTHIPRVPGVDPSATPLLALVAIAVLLTAAGASGLRRRAIGA